MMSNIGLIFRAYQDSDYRDCESLVNGAWGFDNIFSPQQLADIAKLIYTKGSVIGSNYRQVVEDKGRVVGFIFGFNEFADKPRGGFLFGLNFLRQLMLLMGVNFKAKMQLLKVLNTHELHRTKVVARGRSEIVLFVIAPDYQGTGIGKQLIFRFISRCKDSGVQSIIVETNKLGASIFYEHVGFKHLGNFDSPLHELATKGGQACMYEYTC